MRLGSYSPSAARPPAPYAKFDARPIVHGSTSGEGPVQPLPRRIVDAAEDP